MRMRISALTYAIKKYQDSFLKFSRAMTVPLGKKVQANQKGVGRDARCMGYRRLQIRKAEL